MFLLAFRRKLTALALCKSIESAIQRFQIHHRITFAIIQNTAVYLSGARVSIFSRLVPRLSTNKISSASHDCLNHVNSRTKHAASLPVRCRFKLVFTYMYLWNAIAVLGYSFSSCLVEWSNYVKMTCHHVYQLCSHDVLSNRSVNI